MSRLLPYKVSGYTVEPNGELVWIEFYNEAKNHGEAVRDRRNMERRSAPERKFIFEDCSLDMEAIRNGWPKVNA